MYLYIIKIMDIYNIRILINLNFQIMERKIILFFIGLIFIGSFIGAFFAPHQLIITSLSGFLFWGCKKYW